MSLDSIPRDLSYGVDNEVEGRGNLQIVDNWSPATWKNKIDDARSDGDKMIGHPL